MKKLFDFINIELNGKKAIRNRIICQVLLIAALAGILIYINTVNMVSPYNLMISEADTVENGDYVRFKADTLYETGYEVKGGLISKGTLCYAVVEDKFLFVLVPSSTVSVSDGNDYQYNVELLGKVSDSGDLLDEAFTTISKDVGWDKLGLSQLSFGFYIDATTATRIIDDVLAIICILGIVEMLIFIYKNTKKLKKFNEEVKEEKEE